MEETRVPSKAILLVEDNPDDEDLVMRSLRKANIANDVIVKQDGFEALEYLYGPEGVCESGEVPALVLLDLKMPRIGGIEVLLRIRQEPATQYLPVVILTSSSEDEDIVRSYASGANSYVRKPVDFAEFANVVQGLGLYWLLINQVPRIIE
jgi:two-component system response regulator